MKILVTGPESSGKTTLCHALAIELGGAVREEYARVYLEKNGLDYKVADLIKIWKRQVHNEKIMTEENKFIICDTAHFVMAVWNEVKFRDSRLDLKQLIKDSPLDYGYVFLCSPDLIWEADPLRESPDVATRQRLFERYRILIEAAGLDYSIISGEQRLKQALSSLTGSKREFII